MLYFFKEKKKNSIEKSLYTMQNCVYILLGKKCPFSFYIKSFSEINI